MLLETIIFLLLLIIYINMYLFKGPNYVIILTISILNYLFLVLYSTVEIGECTKGLKINDIGTNKQIILIVYTCLKLVKHKTIILTRIII